jgi:hypothetical protein
MVAWGDRIVADGIDPVLCRLPAALLISVACRIPLVEVLAVPVLVAQIITIIWTPPPAPM